MKSLSTVFEDAAALLLDGTLSFCCPAIRLSSDLGQIGEASRTFKDTFKPKSKGRFAPWWPDGDTESRVLALLPCAEICREKKLKPKKKP